MSYIWLRFCSGTSYCLEFSTTSNSHAPRENLPRLVALWNQLRSRLYGENMSWEEGSLAFPSYPEWANFSFIILQTIGDRLQEKQKVSGSARRVTRQTAGTFFVGRVTLLPSQNFYTSTLWITYVGQLMQSRGDNQSMRKRCCLGQRKGQRGQLYSHLNARWSWLSWEGNRLFRNNFSPHK